jgi:hypothetical protein
MGNIFFRNLFKILIYLDIIFLVFSIAFILYTFPHEFVSYNNHILFIIFVYECINIVKIIFLIIYNIIFTKRHIKISKFVKIWLTLSIISFIISLTFFTLLFWVFSNGA